MLNAYPDSIGHNLSTRYNVWKEEFKDVFFLVYVLPYFLIGFDRVFHYNIDLNTDLFPKLI